MGMIQLPLFPIGPNDADYAWQLEQDQLDWLDKYLCDDDPNKD